MGASGSGKSSLARAGVLPMLVQRGVIDGAQAWRRAVFKPGDRGGDPLLALVDALVAPNALPELVADGGSAAELAALLRDEPGGAGLLLRQALTQASAQALVHEQQRLRARLAEFDRQHREEDAREIAARIDALAPPTVRLALLADQLEELFTGEVPPADVERFFDILDKLARTGRVFVLATLRGDFYQNCLAHPKLVALMRGNGTYPLPPPAAADIARMIRQPAAATGLCFENDPTTGEELDDILRDAALADPTALPLLSYTLEQLYERRTPDGTLTLAAYRELGGLEGAIGSRAEAVYQKLPDAARDAFDPVWRKLVTICDEGEPTRRRADYAAVAYLPPQRQLVDALIENRLLIADGAADGGRTVSVAHEALLRHWPRLVEWVRENREFLRTRGRVAQRLAEWKSRDEAPDYLIPRGPELSAAEVALTRHPDALDPAETTYIARSVDAVRRRDQRRLRNARLITAGAVVLCLAATATGLLAVKESHNAKEQRAAALKGEARAATAAADAARSDSRTSFLLGVSRLESGAVNEGLRELRKARAIDPQNPDALDAIASYLLYGPPKPIWLAGGRSPAGAHPGISGGGRQGAQRACWIDETGAPKIIDLDTLDTLQGPWREVRDTLAVSMSEDGKFLVQLQKDLAMRVWDLEQRTAGMIHAAAPDFQQLFVTTDNESMLTARADGSVEIIDARTGAPAGGWKHQRAVTELLESGDEFLISLSCGEADVATDTSASVGGDAGNSNAPKPSAAGEIVIYCRKENRELHRLSLEDSAKGMYHVTAKVAVNAPVLLVQTRTTGADGFHRDRLEWIDIATGARIADRPPIDPDAGIADFALAHDGSTVLVAPYARPPRIYRAGELAPAVVLAFSGQALRAQLSPDGHVCAVGDSEGNVTIHDVGDGRLLFHPLRFDAAISKLGLSWRGTRLSVCAGNAASVWDLSVGTALTPMLSHPAAPLATLFDDDTIRIVDAGKVTTVTHKPVFAALDGLPRPEDTTAWLVAMAAPIAAAYDPPNRAIRFLDLTDPELSLVSKWNAEQIIEYWAISDNGAWFAAISGGRMHFLSTADAVVRSSIPWQGAISSFRIANDGRHVAINGPHENSLLRLRIVATEDGREIAGTDESAMDNVNSYAFSPCGRWLGIHAQPDFQALEKAPNRILVHDLADGEVRDMRMNYFVNEFVFSDDGRHLAASSLDANIQVWDVEAGKPAAPSIRNPHGAAATLRFSPCGTRLAVAVFDPGAGLGVTRIWQWADAIPLSQPLITRRKPASLVFQKDGQRLLTWVNPETEGGDHTLQIWEARADDQSVVETLAFASCVMSADAEGVGVVDPAAGWREFRKAHPQSWYATPLADRSASPGIVFGFGDWLDVSDLRYTEASRFLPAVPAAQARAAYHEQFYLQRRLKASPDADSSETQARIARMADFASRNATIDDEATKYLAWLGMLLWDAGKKDEAKPYLSTAVDSGRLDPSQVSLFLIRLGRAGEACDRHAAEIGDLAKCENVQQLAFYITTAHHAGRHEVAVAAYRRLVEIAPGARDPEIVKTNKVDPLILEALLATLEAIGEDTE
jgi:hypothetical protein